MATIVGSGMTPTPAMLRFYLERPEIHTYVCEEDGEVIGTGAATSYGRRTGWLGVIAVAPAHRGRGLGKALTQWGIEALRSRGAESILLTATPAGRPVYEKLGFVAGRPYLAFMGAGTTGEQAGLRPLAPGDWPALEALDFAATGERRGALLRALGAGYGVGAEGALRGFYLPAVWGGGPAIAADEEAGRLLIDQARRVRGAEPLRIMVPEANEAAVHYLRSLGFTPGNGPVHMVLGPMPEPYRPERIWGLFSFALG